MDIVGTWPDIIILWKNDWEQDICKKLTMRQEIQSWCAIRGVERASVVSTTVPKTGRSGGRASSWMMKRGTHFARRPRWQVDARRLTNSRRHNDLERRTVIERPRHVVKNIGRILSLSERLSVSYEHGNLRFALLIAKRYNISHLRTWQVASNVWSDDLSSYHTREVRETRAKFPEPEQDLVSDFATRYRGRLLDLSGRLCVFKPWRDFSYVPLAIQIMLD